MSLLTFQTANPPTVASILTPSSGAVVLASNTARNKLLIQNTGTNPLFVNFGSTASSTVFHIVLKACSVASDGTGGSYESGNVVWTGSVSVAGTTPTLVAWEL